ncbi:hypothetical protein ABT150_34600 [Streptomyces mirabilis]|uniref:hypothetical protein n=1 Tax=Streptomyces mirabilis TaxID=68239 RepID=UPI003324EEF7
MSEVGWDLGTMYFVDRNGRATVHALCLGTVAPKPGLARQQRHRMIVWPHNCLCHGDSVMTDQPTQKPITAADELRTEIDELVSQMRAKLDEDADQDAYFAVIEQAKAHRSLNYIHGYVTALLLKDDVEGAVKQRRVLREQAWWMRTERFKAPASAAGPGDGAADADAAGKRSAPRPVSFPPVANGIDYLKSVVDHLTVEPEPQPRDLKYAVLHLYAATEVLLKARLSQEHWALVWAEPKNATIKQRETRSFQSCGAGTAIERLGSVLGIRVSDASTKAVAKLGKTRNQLQHDGLTQSALAIEAQAAEVLDFLLAFLHQHLERSVDASQAVELVGIKEQVGDIKAFVRKRRERLSRVLDPVLTVQCPDCDEWALVLNEDGTVTCHFCDTSTDGYRMASRYAEIVLGLSEYAAVEDGGHPPVQACAACPEIAMVAGAVTLADHQAPDPRSAAELGESSHVGPVSSTAAARIRYLCFSCASSWDSTALTTCAHCGTARERTEDGCDLCWECESFFYPSL